MSNPTVVALDHAKIGTLLDFTVERGLPMEQRRNKVFAVLDAALASNDKILLVPSVQDSELGENIADEFLADFNEWLRKELILRASNTTISSQPPPQMGAISVSSAVWKNTIPRSRKAMTLQSS